jgi:hypothetical protein
MNKFCIRDVPKQVPENFATKSNRSRALKSKIKRKVEERFQGLNISSVMNDDEAYLERRRQNDLDDEIKTSVHLLFISLTFTLFLN